MHLAPRDIDKLMLTQAGFLAQRRLARGVRLNQPEAVALIASVLLEFIRDGRRVAELMDLGRQLLGRNQVMPGVPELVGEVQVEGTFPDGTKLVTVHTPICAADGDMTLALYGSGLSPSVKIGVQGAESLIPGEVQVGEGEVALNAGRATASIAVTNLADRPIQVGSHYHFIETNAYLRFDRAASYGMRLDIPAGTAVRFEPGETKTVTLCAIAGNRVVMGGNNLVNGPATPERLPEVMGRVSSFEFRVSSGMPPSPLPPGT